MITDFYEINTKTCALIAKGENKTEIIEGSKTFIINKKPLEILKESCEYFGSTYEGRIKGTKTLLGMCYKLPIAVEGSKELIFFPTMSANKLNCSWLAVKNIQDYRANDEQVFVKFNGNQIKQLNISYESLENQIFRSTKLMLVMRNRRNSAK